jgi:SAM-dependent methyltransferase
VAPLLADDERRQRACAAATSYAAGELSPERHASSLVAACQEIAASRIPPPAFVVAERRAVVDGFLVSGTPRLAAAIGGVDETQWRDVEQEHLLRYRITLEQLPPARPGARLFDVGSWATIMRVLELVWGYQVQACNYHADRRTHIVDLPPAAGLPAYRAEIDHVDVELDRFPYDTASFDVVTSWEVLEHLGRDPMHLLWEANRVLKPGGLLLMTTPNVASLRSLDAVAQGGHPQLWSQFRKSGSPDRHQREYTPRELRTMLGKAGFSTDGVWTENVWDMQHRPIRGALETIGVSLDDRGDDIIVVARVGARRHGRRLHLRRRERVGGRGAGGRGSRRGRRGGHVTRLRGRHVDRSRGWVRHVRVTDQRAGAR